MIRNLSNMFYSERTPWQVRVLCTSAVFCGIVFLVLSVYKAHADDQVAKSLESVTGVFLNLLMLFIGTLIGTHLQRRIDPVPGTSAESAPPTEPPDSAGTT